MAGKHIARKLLTKVFDHIVTLGFAMHQYIHIEGFLAAHGEGDFSLHRRLVARVV